MKRRQLTLHAIILALYAALAVVLTWPLVRHLSTHVPGSYTWSLDEYGYLWNSWWFPYALKHGLSPFASSYMFYPVGVSLILYTYDLPNVLLSLPLQPFLSLPAISNLTFLLHTVMSAYGAFLLVGYLLRTGSEGQMAASEARGPQALSRPALSAAFVAGLIYAYASYRMVYAAIGHCNLWSTAFIPLYTLYLVKTIREGRMRNALLAGLLLVLALLSEMSFGIFLALLTLILLAFAAGRRGRAEVAGGWAGLAKRLAVLVGAATLLYLPLLVPVLREMRAAGAVPGWGDAEKLSVDLAGFVTPTALSPLGGSWVETLRQVREGTARFSDINTVFLGWATLALSLAGAVLFRRKLAAWITTAVASAVLCLGPLLQINGQSLFDLDGLKVTVPLPFILLHYLPVIKANRVPNRFSLVLMLALAVLAAFGVYWLLGKIASGRRLRLRSLLAGCCFLLLASCVVLEHWSAPLPLTDARVPEVYQRLAADPGDYAILQLPLGWRNSFGVQGAENTQTQYYQSVHHKRLLTGNIQRNPAFEFDYFARVPVLQSLIALGLYGEVDAARREADRATAGQMLSFYDIRYVVVAPGIAGRPPYVDTRAAAVAYIEEVLPLEKIYDEDGWLLYKALQPSLPASLRVDLGSGDSLEGMALGEGWSGAEQIMDVSAHWANAQDARLFLPAAAGVDYRLAARALPLDYPGAEPQRVTLSVNGHDLEPVTLSSAWLTYTWEIDASLLRQGVNDLRFHFSRLESPADVVPGDGLIGQTGVVAPLPIEVRSGGAEDFAYITIGDPASGKAVDGSEHGAGYNMAVIDAKTGRLLDKASFDLTETGSEQEAAGMVAWIARIPTGRIVAIALAGCETPYMIPEVAAGMGTFGASAVVGPKYGTGCPHAAIGVMGAGSGTALDSTSGAAWLRAAPDRRTLAMALDAVTWERLDQ